MSKRPPAATPASAFAETRRVFVVDGPANLLPDWPRARLRLQGALWEAALDPAPPPRLHLLLRQPLWTTEETPARRRLTWIGVANLPFLLPPPTDEAGLAAAAAWHLDRAIGRTARRRTEILSLAAGLAAALHGIERWHLDLETMEIRPDTLASILSRAKGHPLGLALPEDWRRELPLLLSGAREGTRGAYERLAARRLLQGTPPATAHARQAARLRLQRLARAAGLEGRLGMGLPDPEAI